VKVQSKDGQAGGVRKPDSVSPPGRGGKHSSGIQVTRDLERPTRRHRPGQPRTPSYLALLRAGFAKHPMLPSGLVGSCPTVSPLPEPQRAIGGLLSVALSVGSPLPPVRRRTALWSPDFPPPPGGGSVCLNPSGLSNAKIRLGIREFHVPDGSIVRPPPGECQKKETFSRLRSPGHPRRR
jgi:hypothetical protein